MTITIVDLCMVNNTHLGCKKYNQNSAKVKIDCLFLHTLVRKYLHRTYEYVSREKMQGGRRQPIIRCYIVKVNALPSAWHIRGL